MLLNTSTQEENAAPYSLQVSLLDYKGLNTDLLAAVRKGLPATPTLIQLARKHPALATIQHTSVCDVCRKLKAVHPMRRTRLSVTLQLKKSPMLTGQ